MKIIIDIHELITAFHWSIRNRMGYLPTTSFQGSQGSGLLHDIDLANLYSFLYPYHIFTHIHNPKMLYKLQGQTNMTLKTSIVVKASCSFSLMFLLVREPVKRDPVGLTVNQNKTR